MTLASQTNPRHVGTLWLLDLGECLPMPLAARVAATFRRVGAEAALSLAQAMGLDTEAAVLSRFRAGRRCYAASVEGALAAYGWVSFKEEGIGEIGLRIHLALGEAYIWDCATLPAYRGQRLYPALLAYIIRELYNEGLHRIWIGADTGNLASQKGMALVGFRPILDVFTADTSDGGHLWVRGHPGAPESLVMDARSALLGADNSL